MCQHGISQGGGFEEELREEWMCYLLQIISLYWESDSVVLMKLSHSTTKGIPGIVSLLCTRIVNLPATLFGGDSYPVHSLGVIPAGVHKIVSFSGGISILRNIQCIYKLVILQVQVTLSMLIPGRWLLCLSPSLWSTSKLHQKPQPASSSLLSNSAWLSLSARYKYCCSFKIHGLPVHQWLPAHFCSGVAEHWEIAIN